MINEAKRYEVSAEIEHRFVQSLISINAGSVVALLAFLAGIWDKSKGLSATVLLCIFIFSLGLAFAVLVNYFRYKLNSSRSKGEQEQLDKYYSYSIRTRFISFGLFIVGIFTLLIGGMFAVTAHS